MHHSGECKTESKCYERMRHCWNPLIRNDKRHSHLGMAHCGHRTNRGGECHECSNACEGRKTFLFSWFRPSHDAYPCSHSVYVLVRCACSSVHKINFKYSLLAPDWCVSISLRHPICHWHSNYCQFSTKTKFARIPSTCSHNPWSMTFERENIFAWCV